MTYVFMFKSTYLFVLWLKWLVYDKKTIPLVAINIVLAQLSAFFWILYWLIFYW